MYGRELDSTGLWPRTPVAPDSSTIFGTEVEVARDVRLWPFQIVSSSLTRPSRPVGVLANIVDCRFTAIGSEPIRGAEIIYYHGLFILH